MITVITLRLRNLNEQYMEEVSFWRPCRRGAELCAFAHFASVAAFAFALPGIEPWS